MKKMINQCDGCRRNLPIVDGIHRGSDLYDVQYCTKGLYMTTYSFDTLDGDKNEDKQFASDAEAEAYAKANAYDIVFIDQEESGMKTIWESERSKKENAEI
jgi:hypothetical protein